MLLDVFIFYFYFRLLNFCYILFQDILLFDALKDIFILFLLKDIHFDAPFRCLP